MKGWFGPGPGNNARYYGSALGINASIMPASWQGWLASAIYGLFQAAILIGGFKLSDAEKSPNLFFLALIVTIIVHVGFLIFASQHAVSYEDTDPAMLPSDERPKDMQG
jgi:hypothetical protein